MSVMLVIVLLLNLGISWWNARVCGQIWLETKAIGGWARFIAWSAAVQSAVGFSSVIMFPVAGLVHLLLPSILNDRMMHATVSLWYLTVIFPILGSGLAITIQSWITAYRERDLLSLGTGAWNTFAMAHNMAGAIESIGPALEAVGSAFSSALDSDDDDGFAKIGLLLVLIIAFGSLFDNTMPTQTQDRHHTDMLTSPHLDCVPWMSGYWLS